MKQQMKSLLAAVLALALVIGLCPVQAGALSEEMESATPITAGEPVEYSLELGEKIWYRITTTRAGQFIQLERTATSTYYPGYQLRDSTGTFMDSDYNGYLTEAAGDYYVNLYNYKSEPVAGTLTVTLLDNDDNEPNNTKETATELKSGDTVDFTVGYDDCDYFKIVTAKPGQDIAVTVSGYNYTNQGEQFYLKYELPGYEWSANVRGNGTYILHAAATGEHYIGLEKYSGGVASRTLSVEVLDGDTHEPNDTRETATALPIGTDGTFSMGGYGDEDWFRFEVARDAGEDQKLCTLNFFDLSSDYSDELYYDLYAPDGTALSTGAYVNIRHSNVFACTQDGVYYLRVYCESTSPSRSTLRVRVDEGGADPYESNDTWLTAAPVQTGQPISFQLANTADEDWFRFEVPQADMTMVLTLNSGKETACWLWDADTLAEYGSSDYDYLARGDISGTARYKFTRPGTYYLRFDSDSGYVSEELRTVTVDLEEATAEENNDTRAAATPLYDGVPQSFDLSAYNDDDWFRIEVPAGTGVLRIRTASKAGGAECYYVYRETDFELAGDNAEPITYSWTSGLTLTAPEAGTYYVKYSYPYMHFGDSDHCSGTIRYELFTEGNTNIAAAAPLQSGVWAEGRYSGSYSYYYSLGELVAGTEVRCYGENIDDFYLLDSEGNTVRSVSGRYGSCALPIEEDGSYYLGVQMDDESIPCRLRCDIATEELGEGEALTLETAADEVTLLVGETWAPEARLAPYTAVSGRTEGLIYYSNYNSSVASCGNYTGKITANAVGTATVKFYLNGDSSVSKTVTVNVVEPTPAESVTVSGAPESLPLGTAVQLTATLNEGARENITWSSSDSGILYVSDTGKVTAVGQGSATVTAATDSGVSDSVTITVTAAPEKKKVTGVQLDDYDLTLYMNEEDAQLTATVTPADADDATVTWSTTNPAVAKVDQTGRVTAVEPGVCVITASASGYRASCVVTVLAARKRVESICFDREELEIRMNAASPLTVIFTPDDATVKTLTWVSSDPDVASVSRTGVVTGLAVGETTVTATTLDGGHAASITVRVTAEGLRGDINGDGYIDAADAMLCLRHAVGLVTLNEAQQKVADVNGDGFIDAGDAIKILRYDAGLLDTLD